MIWFFVAKELYAIIIFGIALEDCFFANICAICWWLFQKKKYRIFEKSMADSIMGYKSVVDKQAVVI